MNNMEAEKKMDETRFRILLIEDDKVDQMAFKRLVKEKDLPYDYLMAGSVSEARKMLRSETFDAVITDYLLGDGTAFDIIGIVADTPVIFVTGAGDEEIALKAMKAGAYDYLIKDPKHNYLNVLSVTTENVIKRKRNEELIQARTAELLRTNEQLKKEIAERIDKEEQIKAALKEKDILLKEIHHRVKNNLQVIYGLLEMHYNNIKDEQSKDMCRSLKNLVITMSLVHKTLYKSRDLTQIDFKDYISKIIDILYESFYVSTERVSLKMNFDVFSFDVNTALSCGLVINELVSNSLKYAFPDNRTGEITVSLTSHNKKEFELIVSDNGIGVPEGLDINKGGTIGLNMVAFFVKSMLRGTMELKRDTGTKTIIRFHADS